VVRGRSRFRRRPRPAADFQRRSEEAVGPGRLAQRPNAETVGEGARVAGSNLLPRLNAEEGTEGTLQREEAGEKRAEITRSPRGA
jgi:hypothetical protein